MVGTTNESQVKLCEKYPDKFRTFVSEQQLKIKVSAGEAKWTIEKPAQVAANHEFARAWN